MSHSADSRPVATLPTALQGLMRPAAYPHPVTALQLVETHMSWVLLTGPYAYKIKRPVQFDFADFRDPAHRAALCAEEIRLNRRFAPELYLDVTPVRLEDGLARFGGDGPVIESAVRMRQFDRRDELDARVAAGSVAAAAFANFGTALAAIHATLPPPPPGTPYGSPASIASVLRRNFAELQRLARSGPCAAALAPLRSALSRRLRSTRSARAARLAAGAIRECHGDLHLSNLVMIAERVTPFDALEFEPAFRYIDVADELAFLCADLEGYGAPGLAQAALQAYLEASGDFGLLEVFDLYLAHRALVRAKIMAIRAASAAAADSATDTAPPAATAATATATATAAPMGRDPPAQRIADYVAVADRALRAAAAHDPPRLVLLHGLSGSGKTWLARQLAPRLGAIHLRSDLERKRLAGLAPLAGSASAPGAGLYAPTASALTYARLASLARQVLASGRSVVCDAAFLARSQRELLRAVGTDAGACVTLLHCTAPDAALRQRLRSRRDAREDASEADESVLDWQLQHAEPVTAEEDAAAGTIDTSADAPLAAALRLLDAR